MNVVDCQDLIDEKNYIKLKREINELNKFDVADLLMQLDHREALLVFRLLNKDMAAEVFAELEWEDQKNIVEMSSDKEVVMLINDLYMDEKVDLLEEMPANVVKKILNNTSVEDRALINHILTYPEESAGSLMTTEFVILKEEMTVREALDYLNKNGEDKETIYISYVTDAVKRLKGFISLRIILTSPLDDLIKDIMTTDVMKVFTQDDQETVADLFVKYGFTVLPVVDEEQRLVGIVTVDDIIDVIEQEDTEDFQVMAGISPTEEPYLDQSALMISKNRIVWLFILMITSAITGSIISGYESVIASVAILSSFVPVLMGTGGNSGGQSSTLVIRSMATGELELSDWRTVLSKELKVSLIVGFMLAFVNFIKVLLIDRVSIPIALVVSLTMMLTVITAMVVGGVLPMIAAKLKLDPAIMAAPLITTIVDAAALLIYFNIATTILRL